MLVRSLRPCSTPAVVTHLDLLHVPQRLLPDILLDLPGRKGVSLREDLFHLDSATTVSIAYTCAICVVLYLFKRSSRRLREHEQDVDKGRSVERRKDKVLCVHQAAQLTTIPKR
jgi:hypothetical protein